MHYDITNGKAKYYSDMEMNRNDDNYTIRGNMTDGRLICERHYYVYNLDGHGGYDFATSLVDLQNNDIHSTLDSYRAIMYNEGNNIYGLNITESYHFREYYFGNIEKYNFTKKEWEPQWDDKIHFVLYGIKNKNTYLWDIDAGHITIISSDGTPQKTNINLKENLTVLDFLDMPTNYTYDKFSGNRDYRRMFITKNESFIFYDKAAGAWRKISKQ